MNSYEIKSISSQEYSNMKLYTVSRYTEEFIMIENKLIYFPISDGQGLIAKECIATCTNLIKFFNFKPALYSSTLVT